MKSMAYPTDAKTIVSPCETIRFCAVISFLRRNELNDLETAMGNRSFRYVANPFAFLLLDRVGTRFAAAARLLWPRSTGSQIMAGLRMAVKRSCAKAQLSR
jgi:hypothetical protein